MVLLIANEVARTFGGDNNGTVCSPYKSYGRRKRCAFKNKASREGDGNITGLIAQPMLSCLPFLLLSRFCHCKYVPPQLRSHQSDRLNSGRHFGATRGNRAVNWFCGLDGRTHGWMEAAWNIRETAPYLESRETHVGEGGARLGSWKRQPSRQVVSAKQILCFHTTGCAIGFAMAVGRSRFP